MLSKSNEWLNPIKARLTALKEKYHADRDFTLFLLVGVFSGIGGGINSTVFNNFLDDAYHLSASARGLVEFPRELPGACIAIILGLLSFMGDIRMAAVGMLAAALGMLGLGVFSPTFAAMMVWMMVMSLGTHFFLPLAPGIGMNLSKKENYGMRLGQYNAYNLVATIIGYGIVWFGFKYLGMNYSFAFIVAAVSYVIAAFVLVKMNPQKPEKKNVKIILRKKYTLFYLLSIVYGARKQIFLTFAPWVLIQVYKVEPPVFAILGVVVSVVSILTRTLVGNAIDRLGERFVLSIGAIILIAICMGYAFAADFAPAGIAVIIIAACYIIDNSMSSVEMAKSTYMKKIAVYQEDVTPTLSAGTSFDHVVAMSIPVFGGMLWTSMGYKYVFIAAAFIALINLVLSLKIKID